MDPDTIKEIDESSDMTLIWFRSLEETEMNKITWPVIKKWIERGDGVAIYENKDLSSTQVGHKKAWSYGSKKTQFEVKTADELPSRLPDLPNEINWRYMLIGVYRPSEQPKELPEIDEED